MNFNSEYKKQYDELFDKNVGMSSDEMLERAMKSSVTEREITMTKASKRKIITRIAAAAAACVVISGTTVYALSSGKLSDFFRRTLKDPVTADIIEEGYLYEMSTTLSDDVFTVDFIAITGDWMNPKFVLDVTINDPEVQAEAQGVRLTAYVLNKDIYEKDRDFYAPCEAYGIQDDKEKNLYHVSLDAPASQIVNMQDVVFDICKIGLVNDGRITDRETDIRFDFKIPMEAIKEYTTKSYADTITVEKDGIKFTLEGSFFSVYETSLTFGIDISNSGILEKYDQFMERDSAVQQVWDEVFMNTVIVVDGVEHRPLRKTVSYCDDSLAVRDPSKYRAPGFYEPIDYTKAKNVTIIFEGREFSLMDEAYWTYCSDGYKKYYVVKDGVETLIRTEEMTAEEMKAIFGKDVQITEPTEAEEPAEETTEETSETEQEGASIEE